MDFCCLTDLLVISTYTGNIRQAYSVLIPANANSRQGESKEPIANYESSLTVKCMMVDRDSCVLPTLGGSQHRVPLGKRFGQKLGCQQNPPEREKLNLTQL